MSSILADDKNKLELRRLNNQHRLIIGLRDIYIRSANDILVYKDNWEKTVKEHALVSGIRLGPRAHIYLDAGRRQLERHGYIEFINDDCEVIRVTKKWERIMEEINIEVSGLCVDAITFLRVFLSVRRKFSKLKALTAESILENENRKLKQENNRLLQQTKASDHANRLEFGIQTVFDHDISTEYVLSLSSDHVTPCLLRFSSVNVPPPVTPASRDSSPAQEVVSPVTPERNLPGICRSPTPFCGFDDDDSPMLYEDSLGHLTQHFATPDEPKLNGRSRFRFSFPFSPMALYKAYKARDAYKRQAVKSKADLRKASVKVRELAADARERSLLAQQSEASPLIQQLFALYRQH
ncbi:hypothetical protein BDQ17DRAFT_1352715 [Cyathus striatus]|nr:hypothetical protein BDQ17DRAFT_1352715 [Cyathus striatus]